MGSSSETWPRIAGAHRLARLWVRTGAVALIAAGSPALLAQSFAPATNVGSTSTAQVATVVITTAGFLNVISVVSQGPGPADFGLVSGGTCVAGTANSTYAVNQTCTVKYNFTPTRPGLRLGAVSLMNGASGRSLGTMYLSGIGTGAMVTFPGSTAIGGVGSGFSGPVGVAVDGSGNVFVGDKQNNLVKEIQATSGTVSASSGVMSFNGFNAPAGVAVDGAGDVFVADSGNHAVREIVPLLTGGLTFNSPVITVGSGFHTPLGVAVDRAGNVFVADSNSGSGGVYEVIAVNGVVNSSSTVMPVGSGFANPVGLAVDSAGDVFVADNSKDAVYEIVAANGVVDGSSTVKQVGSGFGTPVSVAVDAAGDVFVADSANRQVYEIVAVNGAVSTGSVVKQIGSGFSAPSGVALDGNGRLFVADSTNNNVQQIDLTAPGSLQFASTAATATSFDSPESLTLQNAGNSALTFSSLVSTNAAEFPIGNTGTCSTSSPLAPAGICTVDLSFTPLQGGLRGSNLALTDNSLNAVAATQNISVLGIGIVGATAQTITFPQPISPGIIGTSATLAATSSSGLPVTYTLIGGPATLSGSMLTYTGAGVVTVEANQGGSSTYAAAAAVRRSIATAANGRVGVTGAVQTATVTITAPGTAQQINVLTLGAANKDFKLVDGGTCALNTAYTAGQTCTVKYTFTPSAPGLRPGSVSLATGSVSLIVPSTIPVTVLGATALIGIGNGPLATFPASTTASSLAGQFAFLTSPVAVATDGNGDAFIVDSGRSSVTEVVAVNGSVGPSSNSFTVGTGFSNPQDIAIDGAGNVFIADTASRVVRMIQAVDGLITQSSMTLTLNPSISGGPGLASPASVAVDGAGDVFVADSLTNGVYEYTLTNGIFFTLGQISGGFSAPKGVAVDANGDVFVADTGNSAVKEIVASNGVVSSNSPAITVGSGFRFPSSVAVDAAGDVFVLDTPFIKEIVAVNGQVSTSSQVVTISSIAPSTGSIALDGNGHLLIGGFTAQFDMTKPPVMSFANTFVTTTSTDSPKSVSVQNAGNAPLNFNSVATSGTDFTVSDTSTCVTGTPLAAAGICGAAVSFSPQQSGARTGSLALTDDTLSATGSTQTSALSGTATTGTATQTITFPQPPTPAISGAQTTLTAAATSGLPVSYTVVSGPGTISGSTLTYGDAGPVTIEADQYGNGVFAPATPVLDTVAVELGEDVGATSNVQTVPVPITTAGTLGQITVLTLGAANKDFKFVGGGTCQLNVAYTAGQSCTVKYTFTPTQPGQRPGAITLTTGTSPIATLGTLPLLGEGNAPLATYPDGGSVRSIGNNGSNSFNGPQALAADGSGNIFIADTNSGFLKEIFAVNGVVSDNSIVTTLLSGLFAPTGVAVDGSGDVFVVERNNSAVDEIVAVNGSVTASSAVVHVGSGFTSPYGVAVDGSGNVFVADQGHSAVKEIVAVNGVVSSSSTVKTVGSGFRAPAGVAVDRSGNVFVADQANNAVKEIVATGGSVSSLSTVKTVGSGFTNPEGVAVDAAGDVFVSSSNQVKEIVAVNGLVSSSSVVKTVSSGTNQVNGITLDGSGHLFITDTHDNSAAVIDLTAPPALTFTDTVNGQISSDSPQTVTLQNAGTTALAINSVLSTDAAEFPLSATSTCGSASPLASSGTCTELISFQPAQTGPTSGSVVIADNTNNVGTAAQSIAVSGKGIPAPLAAKQAVGSTLLTANHAAASFTPVTGSGGIGAITYSVSPTLPTGLQLSASTGAITGTPTAASTARTYTVTVTDTSSAMATASFSLTVNSAVTATQVVASTLLTANRVAASFTPVTGAGGTGALSYSVSPALPAGLSMASATGVISGTPTVASVATTYTVTVTDTNGATATATFSLAVNGVVNAAQTVASKALTLGRAVTSFTPVTGSGGTGSLSYSVSPALPLGLIFAASTGSITGTPTVAAPAAVYTVTVTDANSATATATFSLTVNAVVAATRSVASIVLTLNRAATAFVPVTAAGGTTPFSYDVSPALPLGLSFSGSTGAVNGTPSVLSAASTYTVTITDANGSTANTTFSLQVSATVTAIQSVATAAFTAGHPATAFTPVAGQGGIGALTYSITPTLPAGLSMSSTTGLISGIPTAASLTTIYTVTVMDTNTATDSATFTMTVNPEVTATQAIGATTLMVNRVATTFAPVVGAGGTGALSYSVSPTLPAGLSLSTSTGSISGTPTVTTAATTYTVTITDANSASSTATFALTVKVATPVVSVTPVRISYGTANTTLTAAVTYTGLVAPTGAVSLVVGAGSAATATCAGASSPLACTASYPTGTLTVAGSPYAVTASIVADTNYSAASGSSLLTVTQAAPSIAWATPSSITYGTPLSGSQLNATVTGVGGLPLSGVLTYTPAAGAYVTAGASQPMGVSFAPTDATDYSTATKSVSIVVNKASVTLAGPTTQPVMVTVHQNAAIAVTATGQLMGSGIALPTGTMSYTTVDAGNTTRDSGTLNIVAGAASIPVSNTLPSGPYTINVSYNGDSNYNAPASATSISVQVMQVTPTIAWTGATISYGTTLGGVLNALATSRSSNVPGTFSYTATPNGGSSSVVTATTVLGVGSYTLGVTFTPTDTVAYTAATATVPLTVTQLALTMTLSSSLNPAIAQSSITFTATTSSTVPTGVVTFLDGNAPIGAGLLANGTASLAINTLPGGSHNITATFGGGVNFSNTTSNVVTEVVADFTLTFSSGGSGTSTATSATVKPGGTAVYTLTISPTAATFLTPITLSVRGLPAGATYTINPSTIAAGAGATPVTLTVNVPAQTAETHPQQRLMNKTAASFAVCLLLLPFSRRMRRSARKWSRLVVLLLALGVSMGLIGCGSSAPVMGSTTYTLILTGTSGSISHSTSLTLTVQ